MMRQLIKALYLLLSLWVLSAGLQASDHSALKVLTTTTMIADMVSAIGGEKVEVSSLMAPGVDPHLYRPTAWDATKIREADVIFYNGLHLEGRMALLFKRMHEQGRAIYAVTASIPEALLLFPGSFEGHPDPHIWFDPVLWLYCVDEVERVLGQRDEVNQSYYAQRADAYRESIKSADMWIRQHLSSIFQAQRVLVTSHDAFNYFGRAYDFEVMGVQGISTVTEAGLADVVLIVDAIRSRGLKAIFVETSVSPALIQRISKDSGVGVGGELFSDSLGDEGMIEKLDSGEILAVDTYLGMIRYNAVVIARGLR